MFSLFLMLIACKGCGAWWVMPPLPQPADNPDPDPFDTAIEEVEPEDTGEYEPPPPSACIYDEVEPNGDVNNPQDLPLEAWMCGVFGEPADTDLFAFDIEDESWIRIWVRAFELGSFANPRAFLLDAGDSSFSASMIGSGLSADLDNTFKLDRGRTLKLGLLEQEDGRTQWGPDYYWRLRVSIVKSPVTWTSEEPVDEDGDDFNNSRESPDILNDGDRVFGRLERTTNDWYAVDIGEERTDVVIQTDSWSHGSPLDPRLTVLGPDGGTVDIASTHDSVYNRDAKVEFTALEAGRYLVKLDTAVTEAGGQPFWYVLDASMTVVASPDTGTE